MNEEDGFDTSFPLRSCRIFINSNMGLSIGYCGDGWWLMMTLLQASVCHCECSSSSSGHNPLTHQWVLKHEQISKRKQPLKTPQSRYCICWQQHIYTCWSLRIDYLTLLSLHPNWSLWLESKRSYVQWNESQPASSELFTCMHTNFLLSLCQ